MTLSTVVLSAILALAGPLIKEREGLRLEAYQDTGGVWTICWGHTRTAKAGIQLDRASCEALLKDDIKTAHRAVRRCSGGAALKDNEQAALISWAFNVGGRAACQSTLMRLVREGAPAREWCPQLKRWVYDNGKRIPGLVNRRQKEYEMCINGSH